MTDLPRVTEILKGFTHYDQVPKDILARAAARGTTVHALCAGLAKGAWIPDGMIPEEYAGYVTSYKKWAEAQVKHFMIVEKRYMDEDWGFTGQLDFVVTCNDDLVYLVDLKTSAKPQKTYPVQMSAYDYLLRLNGIKVHAALIVYLKKDGEFPDIDLIEDMSEEFNIFTCALKCFNYFNRRKNRAGTSS